MRRSKRVSFHREITVKEFLNTVDVPSPELYRAQLNHSTDGEETVNSINVTYMNSSMDMTLDSDSPERTTEVDNTTNKWEPSAEITTAMARQMESQDMGNLTLANAEGAANAESVNNSPTEIKFDNTIVPKTELSKIWSNSKINDSLTDNDSIVRRSIRLLKMSSESTLDIKESMMGSTSMLVPATPRLTPRIIKAPTSTRSRSKRYASATKRTKMSSLVHDNKSSMDTMKFGNETTFHENESILGNESIRHANESVQNQSIHLANCGSGLFATPSTKQPKDFMMFTNDSNTKYTFSNTTDMDFIESTLDSIDKTEQMSVTTSEEQKLEERKRLLDEKRVLSERLAKSKNRIKEYESTREELKRDIQEALKHALHPNSIALLDIAESFANGTRKPFVTFTSIRSYASTYP